MTRGTVGARPDGVCRSPVVSFFRCNVYQSWPVSYTTASSQFMP